MSFKSIPIFLFFLIFMVQPVFSQFYGEIYNKDRNKKVDEDEIDPLEAEYYNRYNFERIQSEQASIREQERMDSIDRVRRWIMATPEELRKLGVSEEYVQELIYLNAMQDSIVNTGMDIYNYRGVGTATEDPDSLSLGQIRGMIEYQKQLLIDKAFSLPDAYVYGHEFFRRNITRLLDDTPVKMRPPENYILGEGDEVNIVLWGRNERNSVYTIDQMGSIFPEIVGKIYLNGIEFSKAKKIIKNRYASVYGDLEDKIEISINYFRMINVNISGEVFNPGGYKFSSINSVFNALTAIDGPNDLGSVRNIMIKRNGKDVKILDIYEYLTDPDSKMDFYLEENDYIVVPAAGPIVNISGEIRRSHNYEMEAGEGIKDLIVYAGGLKADAFTKTINIKRFENNRETLIDVNLDSLTTFNTDFILQNGDSIFVYKIPPNLRNYVDVMGAVRVPGRYQLKKGDRISDILYKAEGPLETADLSKSYVLRLSNELKKQIVPFSLKDVLLNQQSPDNFLLRGLDTIQIIDMEDSRQYYQVYVSGEVNFPGEYEFAEGMTLGDLLALSGGIKSEATASRLEISRMIQEADQDIVSKNDRIIMKRVDINLDRKILKEDEDYELRPYDRIFVRMSPNFEIQQNIIVAGEILFPGEHSLLKKDERLTSVINRAGGLTDFAYQKGARLYRSEDSLGYVLVDLEEVLKNPKSKYNYILTDQDSIYIPKQRDIVTLRGAMSFFDFDSIPQINVPYEPNRTAKHYISKYGSGFGQFGKRNRTYVKQANGQVHKVKDYWIYKKYPKVDQGGVIYVDITDRKKNEKDRKRKKRNRNWNDAFDSLTSKIATILTILVLVQQAQ